MTHLTPGRAGPTVRPPMLSAPQPRSPAPGTLPRRLDRGLIQSGIASRRQRFEELEAALVTICETAALRGAARGVRIDDRETWDQPTWHRYLAVAKRLEPDFMPETRRLLSDIGRLERLLTLPMTLGGHRHQVML